MKLVDLFSGCGGFSLGAHQAGFEVLAAFDIDRDLTSSFAFNFPRTLLHITDISKIGGDAIKAAAGGTVDGIFGGPPCQGFSEIGKRQVSDPRRELVGHFFRIVREIEPKFFVMENVRGLAYSDARGVLDDALIRLDGRYEILGPLIWDASDFGAATKRKRLFVVGVHRDCGDAILMSDIESQKCAPAVVRSAISDLEGAVFKGDNSGFDSWKIAKLGRPAEYARNLRAPDGSFTGHRATVHTAAVIKRFDKVLPGQIDPIGRHPRLTWSGQCPTLRAGTGSDKGSFQSVRPLHPEEPRVITVREAARLQGFPDSHRFHPTIWHSFRMIGNSVSPIMSKAIFTAIGKKMGLHPLALAA